MAKFKLEDFVDIAGAVAEGVAAAQDATRSTDKRDVVVERKVVEAVEKAVAPVLENQSNSEPLVKSRVFRGAVVTIAITAVTAFGDWWVDGEVTQAALSAYGAALWAQGYIIFGRITSRGTPKI